MSASEGATRAFPRRSFWLKMLAAGLLLISLIGWLRLQQSVANWQTLSQIGEIPGPLYLALTGAAIGTGGLVCAVGVWLRHAWAFWLTRGFVVAWQAWSWVDRLWLARSDTALSNWPFALGATVLILGYVFAALAEEERRLYESWRSGNRG